MNLRKYAKGKHCTLRLPGCAAGAENETVVLAHLPSVDKALGIKSPDWWGCWACGSCHDRLDGRSKWEAMPKEKLEVMQAALYETQSALFNAGVLKVKKYG
jgi:hypothetical protein